MADNNHSPQGTQSDPEEGASGWFVVHEAECIDGAEDDEWENVFEASQGDYDFVDDASVNQGNILELFQQQELEQTETEIQKLKRKFVESPQQPGRQETPAETLSPKLQQLQLGSQRGRAKKKLFEDSGNFSETPGSGDRAGSPFQGSRSPFQGSRNVPAHPGGAAAPVTDVTGGGSTTRTDDTIRTILASSNRYNCFLGLFKQLFGVSFGDLTRPFQSDKTCCEDWIGGVCGVNPMLYESVKDQLSDICTYYFITRECTDTKSIVLLCVNLKHQKNRECFMKYLTGLLRVEANAIFLQPPKRRSTPAALYFVNRGRSQMVHTAGPLPQWISKLTLLEHQMNSEKAFCLSDMIQWALDNEYCEESEIALHYAMLAEEDENAEAFLKSNSQVKFVKDCAQMVKHYKKAQMDKMTMSEWLDYRCSKFTETPDGWREIVRFLRMQHIELFRFAGAMQRWLKKVPKKCTIVIYGPPDTGKSTFAMNLTRFLGGRVVSFVNSQSQFWLAPLTEAKSGCIDDATAAFWDYSDTYLRNGLDGNPCSVDRKHRTALQMHFPPLIITTNIDVTKEDRWKYLTSRLTIFTFEQKYKIDSTGKPLYDLTEGSWTSFFNRFWSHLGLSDREDDGDRETRQKIKLFRGGNTETL
ncbi:E1 [Eidolon helvum papillomavirus 1]|uniref:Replication protein E1 n=1 Tax=Eidolon helvum papillomavirus 1 TaxID=1163701 RepID=S4TH63_9PAPI|nr:E1 [Eidolon helvum papillomavirus 1]AGB34177.1 E1 [Eidolon helvum papillomavirus 1]